MGPLIEVKNVEKVFGNGNKKIKVLSNINLSIQPYNLIALRGRSGSGKTTLLNLIGALDQPTNGEIYLEGQPIIQYSEKQNSELRRTKIGFIFQSFGLVPLMTVEENIEFALRIAGIPRQEWSSRIKESIELVGLTKRAKHRPFELSGGEQQRVAIARAIAPKPLLILADEPTAELDSKMAFHIIRVFKELVRNQKTTIIMTTHDPGILEIVEHVYTLEDQKIAMKKKSFLSKCLKYGYCVGILTLLPGSLTACSFFPKEEQTLSPPLVKPAKLDYEVAEVKKGEIIKRVSGTGTLIPQNHLDLSYSKEGGRLKKIYVSEGDLVKKGQTLAELDTGNLTFDIEQAQIDLKKAEIKLKQLQAQNADEYSLEIGQLDIDSLKLRLKQLNKQLSESKISSPINGLVTFVNQIKQGEIVPAFQSIIQVAETSKLQLQYTAITANDVADVKVGMDANVTIKGQPVKGKVVQTPKEVPPDVLQKDPDLYNKSLLISLQSLPKGVKVGDMPDIEIVTAKKENTLIIPKNGLRTLMGTNYVQVLVNNTKREMDIEPGVISSTEVEVLKGLKEGDKVILK